MWPVIKEIIETIYFLSSSALVIGIYLAIKQLKLVKKDIDDRNKRAIVEKSLEYIAYFASEIIPEYDKYRYKFREHVPKPEAIDPSLTDGFDVTIEKLSEGAITEVIIKQELEVHNQLNRLELFSVAILNRLTDEDTVFTPIAKNFCGIVDDERIVISLYRSQGIPYKNLVALYTKWKDRMEVERLELQKQETEHKIKLKGDGYKSVPPIGY